MLQLLLVRQCNALQHIVNCVHIWSGRRRRRRRRRVNAFRNPMHTKCVNAMTSKWLVVTQRQH